MRFLCIAILALCAPITHAQERSTTPGSSEPKVEFLVIEDDGARIEELRVRGQSQRIVVTPKRGGRLAYEIITGDGARDLSAGANTSRGAAGQRVWHVLSF
jgi:hypothetical protein